MKTKRKLRTTILVLLLLAVAAAILAPRIKAFYRDISFDWEERSDAEILVKEYADTHGLSYSDYPESLIELLERNPETETFVLEYPLYEETEYDLSEYAYSDSVPLFLQWDQRWGYEIYGSDVIGITGCGPTCLAMVGYYLTGDDSFNPAAVAAFAEENGYYVKGSGSAWTLISEGGVTLGLQVTEIPLVESRIVANLEAGNPIICAMGPGDFTSSGHYIVLVGVEDGMLRVNDPNSIANSEALWSYEQIESQIRNLWVIQK